MFIPIFRLLNSRKFAIYLLLIFLFILIFSTFLPNYYTLSEEKWNALEREKPVLFWLSSRFSTPFVVKNPVFSITSAFLFLSTLVCTVTRVRKWLSQRESEFRKEKAFSFSAEETSALSGDDLKSRCLTLLLQKKWEYSAEETPEKLLITAQKGIRLGFWGSVIFHAGLLLCFLAAPVTALTLFRGEFIITDGTTVPLREGFISYAGNKPSGLPPVNISAHNLKGVYEKGKYKVDFGGRMKITGAGFEKEYGFSVNKPVNFMGYQFTFHEFGFSPRVIISNKEGVIFDYSLNLRHPEEGDKFELQKGKRLFVLFFPDFIRQADKIGSKSMDTNNPVLLVKLFEGDRQVYKGLLRKGEKTLSEEYTIEFADIKNWGNFIVVKDLGIPVIIMGFLVGITGLFLRSISNERRLEIDFIPHQASTRFRISGYSRYYPAFLEKEVKQMSGMLKGEN